MTNISINKRKCWSEGEKLGIIFGLEHGKKECAKNSTYHHLQLQHCGRTKSKV
jgi:hypothetical protein